MPESQAATSLSERAKRPELIWWLFMCAAVIGFEGLQYHALTHQGLMRDDFCWLSLAREAQLHPNIIFSRFISGFFRPVVHLSFIATYALFGDRPLPYYAGNILLDAFCAFTLARLAFELTRSRVAALVGAILFVTHPQHAEVVVWVSARTSSLMTLFSLLTLISWTRLRTIGRVRWAWLTLLTFAAALGSKEEAAILLPILSLYEFTILRRAAFELEPSQRSKVLARATLIACALLLAAYLAAQYAFQSTNSIVTTGDYVIHLGAIKQCLSRVLRLFVHKRVASQTWAIVSAITLLAGAGILFRGARANLRNTAAFGILLAVIAVLPTSFFRDSIYPMRYDYFATCGAALAWAAIAVRGMERLAEHASPVRTKIFAGAILCLIALLIPVQIHHLTRSMVVFQSDAILGGATHATALKLTDRLKTARGQHLSVRLINPPLPPLDMQCLCHLISGIPLNDVTSVYSGQGETTPPATTEVIEWPRRDP